MIFMPPRHGKSELASRRFPAWYIGRNPEQQIITASYSGELASDFGREVRNIVASQEYANIFQTALREDSRAANRWNTTEGGAYVAAGVGGPITGRGAHIALIDDPYKDREEADSETIRDKVYKWYTSTLYTRLMPNGAIVLIQTRWHDADLAGTLLSNEDEDGDEWEVLELKAIHEDKALWPAWYPIETLKRIKNAIGPRDWNALYQQEPQPDEGTYFKREWFKRYKLEDKPEELSVYGASDYAVTEDDGDYTEHGIGGFDCNEDLYLLNWWSGQKTADVWIDNQIDFIASYQPYVWVAEGGPIRRSVEPFLTKRMQQRSTYCHLEWLTSNKDKVVNSRGFQALASMGKVWIPYTDWGEALIDQLVRFPAGKYDDKVDVCGLFGRLLDQTFGPSRKDDKPKPKRDRWNKAFEEPSDDWKTV